MRGGYRFIVGPVARLALPTCVAVVVGGPSTRVRFETVLLLRLELAIRGAQEALALDWSHPAPLIDDMLDDLVRAAARARPR